MFSPVCAAGKSEIKCFVFVDSYCECLKKIFKLSTDERKSISLRGRESALRFDEEMFDISFIKACTPLVHEILQRR